MNTSDFTSNFWNIYIAVILIVSFAGLVWLLVSQSKAAGKAKRDANGQVETMGHEWDGIEEFNNPLPRWWFYLFVITVLFGIAYFILYPGFASFKGIKGWTSHNQYDAEMKAAQAHYQPLYNKFAGMSIEQMAQDPEAKAVGQNLFNTYCIQCHGSDAKGTKGFPDLTDNDWLWGGDPESIQETIRNGRLGVMQPYGGLDPFPEETARDVAHYVFSLNEDADFKSSRANPERVARGQDIFQNQICFTCHQADGKGLVTLAPNLTDNIWLWGSSEKDVVNTMIKGHTNQLPAWENFLVSKNEDGSEDLSKLRIMTAYVYGLSDHAKDAAPAPAAEPAAATEPADADSVVVEGDVVKFYFATGSKNLAAGSSDALASIIAGVAEGKKAVISGYHDPTGDAAQNEQLAKERAQAVESALMALGVDPSSIELKKPEVTEGDGTNAQARRVEVTLQ